MAEYIEHTCGECIHSEICEHMPTLTGWDVCNPVYCEAFRNAADVVEVVHGKWINGNNIVTCSVCGSIAIPHDGKAYCPYCGAKMDGEDTDG